MVTNNLPAIVYLIGFKTKVSDSRKSRSPRQQQFETFQKWIPGTFWSFYKIKQSGIWRPFFHKNVCVLG